MEKSRPRARYVLGVIMAVALLTLRGRTLVALALHNGVGLLLRSHWQAAMADAAIPSCGAGAVPGAESLLKRALALNPQSARAWLLQGRAAWLAGRCEEAIRDWEHALALAPQDRAAWILYLAAGGNNLQPDPAVAEGVAAYFLFLGDRGQKAEQWEEAQRWYALAFSVHPNRRAAGKLEALYLKLERKEAAVAVWEELAAELPVPDPDRWWALGRAAELSEQWERAALFYGEGARRSPKPYDFRMREGAAWERLKDWARAEAAYRRALEARPDLFWPYLSIGHMRRVQQDTDGALAWYREAETLAPNRYEPKYWVGLAHYLREEDPAAEASFRAALELNPQHAWSAYYLAQSLYRQGRRGEAVEWLQKAITLYSGKPWNWAVQLGDWLAEGGDKEGALTAYRQALEWKPGDEGIRAKIRALEE
ncbi:MAG: tetratricopeptide repeat protein [Anaerolineae bacterium]